MRVTVITENNSLTESLSQNQSLTIINSYSSLEHEYEKFSSDLNQVDVFLLVDYNDLSKEFSKIFKFIQDNHSYLLKTNEIVIITYEDETLSPTPGAKDKITSFKEYVEEHTEYKVRIVKLETIDFKSIYEGIIRETTLAEDDVIEYNKYKVSKSSGGVNLKPKKITVKLSPEETRDPASLREQDYETSRMLKDKPVDIKEDKDAILRRDRTLTKIKNFERQKTPLYIVCGVKYSGKTTFILRALNEIYKNGYPALGIDATGQSDFARLQKFNTTDFNILKNNDIFFVTDESTSLIELKNKAPTASFISSLTAATNGKICLMCETSVELINNYIDSYTGRSYVIVVTEYDFTKLRDLGRALLGNEHRLIVMINDRGSTVDEDTMASTIFDTITNVESVGFFSDIKDAVEKLGVY